jgi:uncharacterized membrane protein
VPVCGAACRFQDSAHSPSGREPDPGWQSLCEVRSSDRRRSGAGTTSIKAGHTWLSYRTREMRKGTFMASVEQTIEVNLPVRTVYNQWTQFEEFPQFMQGVEEVRQLDDTRLHWRATIAGKTEEWDAVITDQIPDQQVGWRSTSGSENSGVIRFTPMGADRTRVTAVIGYEPEGIVEQVGDKLGVVESRVKGDLERFKEFIESRGSETGAWRGEIQGGTVESGASSF